MRLLLDNALSPRLVPVLRAQGIDAVHVRELGLTSASDATILERAALDDRIIVSRDGDFSTLLATTHLAGPSFVHLRSPGANRPEEQAELILQVLTVAGDDLANGAIVTVRNSTVRVRTLPLNRT